MKWLTWDNSELGAYVSQRAGREGREMLMMWTDAQTLKGNMIELTAATSFTGSFHVTFDTEKP